MKTPPPHGPVTESHAAPEHALTDGAEPITPRTLKETMKVLNGIADGRLKAQVEERTPRPNAAT